LLEYIERLVKETGIKPSIYQIELQPFFNQADNENGTKTIITEPWSSLARANDVIKHAMIQKIANRHNQSV
jgi:diketogulonate reductase-like aldo/keto reductase